MSNSDYNKIISTINSVSRDYTYSPDPNNLICIDTSNNRIGINTLDPQESLHISGGNILVKTIRAERIFYDYIYANQGSSSVVGDSTISVSSVSATSSITAPLVSATSSITSPLVTATSSITAPLVTATNIRVTNNIDISIGRITANNIDISSTLDISRGRIIANNIDVSSTLDISRGRIIANNIDVSSVLDISRGRIIANNIDISSILDISRGRIIANYIDISSVLDISRGRIIANYIDISSTLDISRGRIIANYIDISSTLDISRGRIIANFIDVSSTLDISRGRIIANYIDISSVLDISRGRIIANNIEISSTLDISSGTILANTISGSAIIINVNANASSDIITINIGNSNGVKINTATTSDANAITINGVRLATTQHIKNVIPIGVIMAYYSTPAPPGWAICDGSNGTPDLRGKFILGGGINASGTGGIISSDNSFIYHTFYTSGIFIPTINTSVNLIVVGGGGGGASYTTIQDIGAAGGKGGTVIQQTHSVTINTHYTITVGAGGAPSNTGISGGESSFHNIINAAGGNRAVLNDVSDGTLVNIFNTSYFMGGDGGGIYFSDVKLINGGAGGGGGSGNAISGKGGMGGINPGGDGKSGTGGTGIGGNGGANTGGGGGGSFYNIDDSNTPGGGGSGIVIVYYPHTSISSNGSNRLTPRPIGVSGGEENTRLNLTNIPAHVHNYNFTNNITAGSTSGINIANSGNVRQDGAVSSVGGAGLGLAVPHNNMPPFYVLIYIMKTSDYDFCYNLVATVPSAPNFTAVQSGLTSVIVNWSVPSNNGGSAINYYSIFMNDINQTNPSASTFTYTKTGLTSGQPYVFKVTATNTQGTSLSISPISITMATLPSAPTISAGSSVGQGVFTEQTYSYESYDVTINWSHPANGGSPITAYNMYVNGSTSPIVINASLTSTIINVLYNTTTTIIMKSQTVAGLSPNSNTLTITV